MYIFASLSLVERLRLITVSKRWLRLLLVDLRVVLTEHLWRAPTVVRRAGDALRTLHVPGLGNAYTLFEKRTTLEDLVQALEGVAGAQLRTLVTWEPTDDADAVFFSAAQAMRLAAACPLLGASSRVALHPGNWAEQAVSLLDALPGRHFVGLFSIGKTTENPFSTIGPLAAAQLALRALVRHPRLSGLDVNISDSHFLVQQMYPYQACLSAAAMSTLAEAFGAGDLPPLEYLSVSSNTERGRAQAFADAAEIEAAFRAAGDHEAAGSIRHLRISGNCCPEVTRCALLASRGSLQHLQVFASEAFGGGGGDGAAALAAMLRHVGSRLETLRMHPAWVENAVVEVADEWIETPFLPGLAPLLSSPDCRLHTLTVERASLVQMAAAAAPLAAAEQQEQGGQAALPVTSALQVFLDALSSNRSLTELDLSKCQMDERESAMLSAALAARAAPLRELRL